jgi:divalent metal cation (Fe/Co/Zn/Cd) transporter
MSKSNKNLAARWLSYFTVGYNLLEGIVSVFFGYSGGSLALAGFGLDSFIESISGGIMIWRFKERKELTHEEEEKIEARAIKLVAMAFYALGIYVLINSVLNLYNHSAPEKSIAGIIIAIVSLVTMPILFVFKHRTGKSIGSKSLIADSRQTLACMVLSVILLAGVSLNYLWQIWWSDSVASILIAILLVREGYRTYREGKLCEC